MTQRSSPWTELFSAALTPLIAIVAGYVAWRQHKLDRLKARQSLFDRRFAHLQTTIEFIVRVTTNGKPTNEEVLRFRKIQDEAYFLFDKSVAEYMDVLFRKSLQLRNVQRQLTESNFAGLSPDERAAVISQDAELFKWFGDQAKDVRNKFDPYLRLPL